MFYYKTYILESGFSVIMMVYIRYVIYITENGQVSKRFPIRNKDKTSIMRK